MSYINEIRKKVGHDPVFMPCSCGVIMENDKILLQKRTDDGTWALNGGSLEFGETFDDALKREMREELGIDVIDYELICYFGGEITHHIYPNKDEVYPIGLVFYIKKYLGEITPDYDEVSELDWFSIDRLPDNFFDADLSIIPKIKEYYQNNK